MAKRLTEDERQRIIELLHDGHSRAHIARETGRGVGTVNRIAEAIGVRADQSVASRTRGAREARSAYSAERRATSAAKAQQRADELLDRMVGRYLVFNFGGRDNTYEEHELEQPPVEALRAMAAAYRDLVRTVLDVDRHDNRQDEGLAAVDQWLRDIAGGAT